MGRKEAIRKLNLEHEIEFMNRQGPLKRYIPLEL